MMRSITVTLAAAVAGAFAAWVGGAHGVSEHDDRKRQDRRRARRSPRDHRRDDPDDAREQGLRASYSNATTAAKYKSVVALFVMNDAGVADRSPTWRAARPSNRRG